jgi:UDP-N-acetylmuramoyl-L-alanyl-D-glutamate--2,6-diaminopimelate ligase
VTNRLLRSIRGISSYIEAIEPGMIYAATLEDKDRLGFVGRAISRGAYKIIVQEDDPLLPEIRRTCQGEKGSLVSVKNVAEILAEKSAEFYKNPSKTLKLFGVVGTNGKTTSAYLLRHLLRAQGKKVALISGLTHYIEDEAFEWSVRMPRSDYLQAFFSLCVQKGIECVVLETSAQGLHDGRALGLKYDGVIFTNITREHGNIFSTMASYFNTKKKIFSLLRETESPIVIHDLDDRWTRKIIESSSRKIFTVGSTSRSDYFFASKKESLHEQSMEINGSKKKIEIKTVLSGEYNRFNIAGVIALLELLGLSGAIEGNIKDFSGAPGRLEKYTLPHGGVLYIDYAHSPDAYEKVLSNLKRYTEHLIVVASAEGEKDKGKRPLIGEAVGAYGDEVLLTTDHIYDESPMDIMNDIEKGCRRVTSCSLQKEGSRKKAIRRACFLSQRKSIVVILGMGAEKGVWVNRRLMPHSDKEVVLRTIEEMKREGCSDESSF